MATINPSSVVLIKEQTQLFTTDISSPVWTLHGGGSLDQSGNFTAPDSFGSLIVEAASDFWASHNGTKLTLNPDDSFTVISNGYGYGDAVANLALTQAGDFVEIEAGENDPFWIVFGTVDTNKFFGVYAGNIFERNGGDTNHGSISIVAGDKVRFRLNSSGLLAVYKNGVLHSTANNPISGVNFLIGIDDATATSVVIKKPLVGGSGITGYTFAQANVTVQMSVEPYLSGDSLVQHIPKAALESWHAANKLENTGSEITLVDISKNNRHLFVGANIPAIQTNVLNGLPAIYFDGTKNPLAFSGALQSKHIFILAAFDGSSFTSNYEGLMSDIATNALLVGQDPGATKFFNLILGSQYTYRKADVIYPEANQSAPVDGKFAVLELIFKDGWTLDGIQIGRDRNYAGRLWKGWYVESLIYSTVKNDLERSKIYQYFAMKYHLWQEDAAGYYIYPFPANRSRSAERDQEYYLSEPYDGNLKALTRGSFKRDFQMPFELRPQSEFEAAEVFHEQHHPLGKFKIRDYRYYPAQDRLCRFTSPIREQGSQVSYRFNYTFDVIDAYFADAERCFRRKVNMISHEGEHHFAPR